MSQKQPKSEFVKKLKEIKEPASSRGTLWRVQDVEIPDGAVRLPGSLVLPVHARGLVIFAHGSGSSRLSPRNLQVSQTLNRGALGTLVFDLLTESEAEHRENVFDVHLLARRLIVATRWVRHQEMTRRIPLGYFGASTGAAAALWAAAELKHEISAVVSRGGRPDLAFSRLKEVVSPTLLLVGSEDDVVLKMNQHALPWLMTATLVVIPGATHLFEEAGALERVAEYARQWFVDHFSME
jgi:putative phosphoribosyl transferase